LALIIFDIVDIYALFKEVGQRFYVVDIGCDVRRKVAMDVLGRLHHLLSQLRVQSGLQEAVIASKDHVAGKFQFLLKFDKTVDPTLVKVSSSKLLNFKLRALKSSPCSIIS
jgi:hypothetical protein